MVLEGEKVLGGFQHSTPPPPTPGTGCIKGVQGVSGASAVHFGKNFIKQKLQGTPDLVGGESPFWAPHPDLEGHVPYVLLETWSINMKVT